MNVAMNDLDPKGVDTAEADVISDRLRAELFRTGFFTVVERGQMDAILKEQGFQQSGCISDECAVEMGQLLGVENMIAGTIGKVGKTYTINIRLIYVATGRILHMAHVDHLGTIDEVLSKSTIKLAQRLVANIKAVSVDEPVVAEKKVVQKVVEKGSLTVNTVPQGARVLLSKVEKGRTPYTGSGIAAGTYTLEVKLRSYITVEKNIRVSADKVSAHRFRLKHTTTYLDSLKTAKRIGNGSEVDYTKTKHIWPKVVLGIITVAGGAVGAVMNMQAEEKVNDYMAIKADYQNSSSNADYDEYSKNYKAAYNEADEKMKIRNICYIVAGAGIVCFAVSFAF